MAWRVRGERVVQHRSGARGPGGNDADTVTQTITSAVTARSHPQGPRLGGGRLGFGSCPLCAVRDDFMFFVGNGMIQSFFSKYKHFDQLKIDDAQ